jgi:hypothetical protein
VSTGLLLTLLHGGSPYHPRDELNQGAHPFWADYASAFSEARPW